MIKLKELLSETSISMGQVHSNPYVHSFKSPEQIEEKVARPFSEHLRKAQDEIEYMISNGPTPDGDDGVMKFTSFSEVFESDGVSVELVDCQYCDLSFKFMEEISRKMKKFNQGK